MILILTDVKVDKLYFGVNRPQSWWDEHPAHLKMLDKMVDSFKLEGVKYPLSVVNEKDDGTYVVTVGNRRLAALHKANMKYAPCLVANKEGQKNIPEGKEITIRRNIKIYDKVTDEEIWLRPHLIID